MGRLLELQTEVTLSRSVASNAQAESERLNALTQELREVSLPAASTVSVTRESVQQNMRNQYYLTMELMHKGIH